MKYKASWYLITNYNDGAGNSCTYYYNFTVPQATTYTTGREWTRATNIIWKPFSINCYLPSVTRTITACLQGSPVGAPPAASARSMTMTNAGIMAWGASETWNGGQYLCITLSEVEMHPYMAFEFTVLAKNATPLYATVTGDLNGVSLGATSQPTEDITYHNLAFNASGHYFQVSLGALAGDVTDKRLRPCGVWWGETTLLTREYTGMGIELAGKGVLGLLQAAKGRFGGVAAQAYTYLVGGRSPVALDIPVTRERVVAGG